MLVRGTFFEDRENNEFYTVLKLAMQHTFCRVRISPGNRPLENPSHTSHALTAPHTLCGRALAQHLLQVIAAQGDSATRIRVRLSAHSPLAGTLLKGCAAAGPCKSVALDSVHLFVTCARTNSIFIRTRCRNTRGSGFREAACTCMLGLVLSQRVLTSD